MSLDTPALSGRASLEGWLPLPVRRQVWFHCGVRRTVLAEAGRGLYWLLPTAAASLLGGLTNAWLFLVREA